MQNDQIICYCDNVTKGQILEAMEQGAKTLRDIKRMTGACTTCNCRSSRLRRQWSNRSYRQTGSRRSWSNGRL